MNHSSQRGFTLTEMTLAMGAIAFLILFVLFAVVHSIGLYTKGITMRQINQSGRQVADDMVRDIRQSNTANIVLEPTQKNRFCVGNKAYIWNTASTNLATTNNLFDDPANGNPPVRFVIANGSQYCNDPNLKISLGASNVLSSSMDLHELSITQHQPSVPIYNIRVVIATAAPNAPRTPATSTNGAYECDPAFGQYCAFGDFSTSVYAIRN